jgi:hypothetical protein
MEARHSSSKTTEQTNDPTYNNLAACQYSNEDLKTSNMIRISDQLANTDKNVVTFSTPGTKGLHPWDQRVARYSDFLDIRTLHLMNILVHISM